MPCGDFLDVAVDPAPPVPQQPSPTPPSSPQVKTEPVDLTPEHPHPFFALKSPTPATSAHPTSSPESPMPVASPSQQYHSTRSTKGHAPAPNMWNVTDYLHGKVCCA
jgi:hypothetical protein